MLGLVLIVGVLHIFQKFCWGTAHFWAILLGHDTFLKKLKMSSSLSSVLFMTAPLGKGHKNLLTRAGGGVQGHEIL